MVRILVNIFKYNSFIYFNTLHIYYKTLGIFAQIFGIILISGRFSKCFNVISMDIYSVI